MIEVFIDFWRNDDVKIASGVYLTGVIDTSTYVLGLVISGQWIVVDNACLFINKPAI